MNLLSNAQNCFPLNISIKESTNTYSPPHNIIRSQNIELINTKKSGARCLLVGWVPAHAPLPILPRNHNLWVSTMYSSWKGGSSIRKLLEWKTNCRGVGEKEIKQKTIPQKLRDKLFSAYHHIWRWEKRVFWTLDRIGASCYHYSLVNTRWSSNILCS